MCGRAGLLAGLLSVCRPTHHEGEDALDGLDDAQHMVGVVPERLHHQRRQQRTGQAACNKDHHSSSHGSVVVTSPVPVPSSLPACPWAYVPGCLLPPRT